MADTTACDNGAAMAQIAMASSTLAIVTFAIDPAPIEILLVIIVSVIISSGVVLEIAVLVVGAVSCLVVVRIKDVVMAAFRWNLARSLEAARGGVFVVLHFSYSEDRGMVASSV